MLFQVGDKVKVTDCVTVVDRLRDAVGEVTKVSDRLNLEVQEVTIKYPDGVFQAALTDFDTIELVHREGYTNLTTEPSILVAPIQDLNLNEGDVVQCVRSYVGVFVEGYIYTWTSAGLVIEADTIQNTVSTFRVVSRAIASATQAPTTMDNPNQPTEAAQQPLEADQQPDKVDNVIKAWGKTEGLMGFYYTSNLTDWLYERCFSFKSDSSLDYKDYSNRNKLFKPEVSKDHFGQVSLFMNRKKFDAGTRTAMKVGRAFKLMYPELSDKVVAELVDAYRTKFAPKEYTLHSSQKASDFKKAYQHKQAPMENPYTTSSRKSIGNSCMRYTFDDLPNHPAEAYASGDFTIYWCEDKVGNIASRCVVHTHSEGDIITPQAGPIYGVCENSIDKIADKLHELNTVMFPKSAWGGARMTVMEHDGGYIAPYLDSDPNCFSHIGNHLIICSDGDIEADNHEHGIQGVGASRYSCYECGEHMSEDEMYYGSNDITYCECCYGDLFTFCELTEEMVPSYEVSTYYYLNSRGGTVSATGHDDAIERGCTYIESLSEYWLDEDVILGDLTYNDEPITQKSINDGDYALCEWSDLWYPTSQLVTVLDDDEELTVSSNALLEDRDTWVLDEVLGMYCKVQEDDDSNEEEQEEKVA